MLCRQQKKTKLTTPYYNTPLTVTRRQGSRITAGANGRYITRHANYFKAYRGAPEDQHDVLSDSRGTVRQEEEEHGGREVEPDEGTPPQGEIPCEAQVPEGNSLQDGHIASEPEQPVRESEGRPQRARRAPDRYGNYERN